jgi:NAD+ kinase
VTIGLVAHAGRSASVAAAADAARMLLDLGVEVRVARREDPDDPEADELDDLAPILDAAAVATGIDLLVSFGGDGTFLRAAHLARDAGIPVLGVNLGRLGFLAEIELDELKAAMSSVALGAFSVEDRPTLRVTIDGADGTPQWEGWALNEVAIEKTARQRLIVMDVRLDEELFAKVPADALILATATGSTAYALSAGGPIVSPRIEATLVVPVAPHTLFDRTLVASPDEVVRVELLADQAPAVVACDGREPIELEPGGSVRVVGGGLPVRLARVAPHEFTGLVRRKFGLL